MKRSELKEIIRQELNEAKKYPSQDEAESMSDWYDAVNGISLFGNEVRAEFDKADKIRIKLHLKIFGDKSPWSLDRKGNKTKVVWDKHKAEKLGL